MLLLLLPHPKPKTLNHLRVSIPVAGVWAATSGFRSGVHDDSRSSRLTSWGYTGIMEKKMKTTMVYWGYNGIMEKKNGNYYNIGVYIEQLRIVGPCQGSHRRNLHVMSARNGVNLWHSFRNLPLGHAGCFGRRPFYISSG